VARHAEQEADVVVVGYGGAGAAAALRAAQLGASVLILEKQAENAHTPSTLMSGGNIMAVNDVDRGTEYLDRCAGGMVPEAVTRAWAKKSLNVTAWLDELGTDLHLRRVGGPLYPMLDGAEAIDVYHQGTSASDDSALRPGRGFFEALARAVAREQQIRVLWEAPGHRLVRNSDGRIVAVDVRVGGGGRRIGARKGVVLATGGYEFDEEMKLNYLKAAPVYFYGNPGNTGDGVRMAQNVGADLWHMNTMAGRAVCHFELDSGASFNFMALLEPGGYVITDKRGRRFANEEPQAKLTFSFLHELFAFDAEVHTEYTRIPSYWFFDRRRLEAGPLVETGAGAVAVGLYDWSAGNRKEIELGWIKVGNSIAEVAAAAGVKDPGAAERSIAEYNEACHRGNDLLGRSDASLIPIDRPPYGCVVLYPGGPCTCGGPRKDAHAQVIDVYGDPIPGLYAAGELGEAVGLLVPSNGTNLSQALCFGQLAVESAVGRA
jgi:succinate dehydrogenase/fumarate reductase flavoprotein subunit